MIAMEPVAVSNIWFKYREKKLVTTVYSIFDSSTLQCKNRINASNIGTSLGKKQQTDTQPVVVAKTGLGIQKRHC